MVATADLVHPVEIPVTSRDRYISFLHALNLRDAGEHTGDWHFEACFYTARPNGFPVLLAGEGEDVNTNPSLDHLGVRDMACALLGHRLVTSSKPVFVANHYRAIADMAATGLVHGRAPRLVNSEINGWLDTEDQIERLLAEYLRPLRAQFDPPMQEIFDRWVTTIHYLD